MCKDIINIEGIKCRITSGVHQGCGDIFLTPGDGRVDYEGNSLGFTEDESIIINKKFNDRLNLSSSTFMGHLYGRRVTMLSLYISSEEIQEMFKNYFLNNFLKSLVV